MRKLRFRLVLVLVASVAVLPMSAGAAAATYATQGQMSMGTTGQDCPCCDAGQKAAADFCMLKCFGAAAIVVEGSELVEVIREAFPVIAVASLTPFSPSLDPRPPRS